MPPFPVREPILAAILCGVICGIGGGLILRSAGSAGGFDILAVYLNRKFDLRLGWTSFMTSALIMIAATFFFSLEMALYTAIFQFHPGQADRSVITGFNKRKTLIIVYNSSRKSAQAILESPAPGVTLLEGVGAIPGSQGSFSAW